MGACPRSWPQSVCVRAMLSTFRALWIVQRSKWDAEIRLQSSAMGPKAKLRVPPVMPNRFCPVHWSITFLAFCVLRTASHDISLRIGGALTVDGEHAADSQDWLQGWTLWAEKVVAQGGISLGNGS
eukprot:6464440-Amphidinium_carterae.1